ncbi:hypothetical protein [Bradyrhizobium sp. HKCCYLRH1062]|uniref:hypothetical protein n=1 Tax=unclassified Bradyrhizobium TaxID=2631580 RepID=UPI003EBD9B38
MSSIKRLREYKRQAGPSGASRSPVDLGYWAERASENSYHSGQKKPKAGGPGRTDKNHVGEDDYMPNVRRVSA